MCSSLKFKSEASHLDLLFFVFELIFTWYTTTFLCFVILNFFGSKPPYLQSHLNRKAGSAPKVAHYRKNSNYETVKGGCITSKYKFKTQMYNKVRWLASDLNFTLLHTGCPNAHDLTRFLPWIWTTRWF